MFPVSNKLNIQSVCFNAVEKSDRIKTAGLQALQGSSKDENYCDTFSENFADKWLVSVPENTPLSRLVVFKDNFRGQVVNGIKQSEFHRFNALFESIKLGKTKLKIEGDAHFCEKVHGFIENLMQTSRGRELFDQLLSEKHSKVPIHIQPGPNYVLTFDENRHMVIQLAVDSKHLLSIAREVGTFTKILIQRRDEVRFAHELTHALHYIQGADLDLQLYPTLGYEYTDLEEQVTITGFYDKPTFDPQTAKRAETIYQLYGTVGITDGKCRYNPINEWLISTSLNQHCRLSHKAVVLPSKEISHVKEIYDFYRHLVAQGMDTEAEEIKRESLEMLEAYLSSLQPCDNNIQHALLLAALFQDIPKVEQLLKKGSDPSSLFHQEVFFYGKHSQDFLKFLWKIGARFPDSEQQFHKGSVCSISKKKEYIAALPIPKVKFLTTSGLLETQVKPVRTGFDLR